MTNIAPGTRPDLDLSPEARRRRRLGWVAFGCGVILDAGGILLITIGALGAPGWVLLCGVVLLLAGTAGVVWGLYEFYRTLTRGIPVYTRPEAPTSDDPDTDVS